jgi:hypothetical protein
VPNGVLNETLSGNKMMDKLTYPDEIITLQEGKLDSLHLSVIKVGNVSTTLHFLTTFVRVHVAS